MTSTTENNHVALQRKHPDQFWVMFTLQVTTRPLFVFVVILPDISNTSTLKTGDVPFSMVSSSSGSIRNSLGSPNKY